MSICAVCSFLMSGWVIVLDCNTFTYIQLVFCVSPMYATGLESSDYRAVRFYVTSKHNNICV